MLLLLVVLILVLLAVVLQELVVEAVVLLPLSCSRSRSAISMFTQNPALSDSFGMFPSFLPSFASETYLTPPPIFCSAFQCHSYASELLNSLAFFPVLIRSTTATADVSMAQVLLSSSPSNIRYFSFYSTMRASCRTDSHDVLSHSCFRTCFCASVDALAQACFTLSPCLSL